jgi:alpha/beta superfamily hydrolase
VAVFGYSFGAGVALAAAARESTDGTPPKAVSVLAPPDRIDDINAGAAVSTIDCNLQVLYGERDTTVDSTAVITQAREQGADVTALAADHHFVGQDTTGGATVAEFLFAQLS